MRTGLKCLLIQNARYGKDSDLTEDYVADIWEF